MNIEQLRELCLSFPGVTEQIQWGDDLLFKVGGKMFAVTPLIPAKVCLSFKADDEAFADLIERPDIIPAPYLARAKWVALETREALSFPELSQLLRASYDLVLAKLPRAIQQQIVSRGHAAKQSRKKSQPRSRKTPKKKARR